MRLSASSGLAWLSLGGAMALADAAAAQESPAMCAACEAGKHTASAHAVTGNPYMAPVAVERKPHGLIGHLMGRKRYVVPAYHQVAGEQPKPVYADPSSAPTGTPPSIVTAPPATVLAESAPPSYADPYGSYANQGPTYGPDAIPASAWGEPEPVGVMRTDYQTQMGPAGAARSSMPPQAPGHASTGQPPAMQDQSIAMWHTVMPSGSSMVAGGDRRSLLSRLASGDVDLGFDGWAEKRMARRMSRYYRSTGSVPYQPGARSVPSMAVGAPH